MIQVSLTGRCHGTTLLFAAALLVGCTPLYLSDTHTTSTPRSQVFDVAELSREPVATLGLVSPASLQGFNPPLSHALNAALSEVSPPIRGIAAHETVNMLNEKGQAAQYGALIAGFGRAGILEREPLQRIGSALSSRYVLLPGLGDYRSAFHLWLEFDSEPGHDSEAMVAALGDTDWKDSLGVSWGSHRRDQAPQVGADRCP
jgi:hypothetical protein